MKSQSTKLKNVHFLKLEKGEDVISSIVGYCKKKEITSGAVFGIGAVYTPSLGYFDLEKKEYITNVYDFNAEIVHCSGNIAINKETGEYMTHLHMAVGDPEGNTYGGHVMPNNTISVTGEFILFETDITLSRAVDEEFKLLLMDMK